MSIAQIVQGGVVVNTIAVDPTSVVSPDGSKLTWASGEYRSPPGASLMMQPGAGIGWTVSGNVLVAPAIAPPAPTQAQLQAYAGGKIAVLLGNMRSYTVSGVTLKSDATPATLADLTALIQWGTANPTLSQDWVANDFSTAMITGAQFVALAPQVGNYALSVYAALASVLGAISADTITTTAQIDAFAWPA